MKISKTHHIRKEGTGKGKPRLNPRTDHPGPLSRINELKRLKKQELSEKETPIIQLPAKPETKTRSKQEILFFEIGPTCRVCNQPTGEDWTLGEEEIVCPKCKHKYKRSQFSH